MKKSIEKKSSGLLSYGSLLGSSSKKKKALPTTSTQDEVDPLVAVSESASNVLKGAMDAANAKAALEGMKEQMEKIKSLAHRGPMTFRVMAFLGGCGMLFQCLFGSLGKLLSFSPLRALIEVYCGIFGLITIILEGQDFEFLKKFRTMINKNAKFLTFTWGRGIFYFFAGSLMFSQMNLIDMAVGGWMCFVGFTSIVVGQQTANKLTDLRKTLGSEKVVRAKFDEVDKDKSGSLDSKELAALCVALGSPLDHNELVAALSTMDVDGNGAISYEEFYGWWAGWSHEKESIKGQMAV